MAFEPEYCPYSDCSHHRRASFPWRRRGSYRRKVDGRRVQRFQCLGCLRTFSTQTFRLDYRLKKPHLNRRVFEHLVAKTTLRQTARALETTRRTVERRLLLLGRHCEEFHLERLRRGRVRGGLRGSFSLDELETYETHRKLKPVTVPVLIERKSCFVLHSETAPLAPRRPRTPTQEARLREIELVEGRRRSGSALVVRRAFEVLAMNVAQDGCVFVTTDLKQTYHVCLRRLFGRRLCHWRIHSKRKRNTGNPLFKINLTLAMMRDGVSRLVRRTWAAAKLRGRLETHLWVWIGYRNYVRAMTNAEDKKGGLTPAMAIGLESRRWGVSEFLRWRVGPAAVADAQ